MEEKHVTKEEVWAAFAETDRQLAELRAILTENAKVAAKAAEENREENRKYAEENRKYVEENRKYVEENHKHAEEARERQEEAERLFQTTKEEHDRTIAETWEQIRKTDKIVKAVSKQLGGMANSDGDFAEDYFYNALNDTMQFGGQHYDEVVPNVKRKKNGIRDEFDVVMYNGTSVAIIEVKYKADLDDLEILTTQTVENFRLFFPQYANYKLYLGIGSMSFNKKVLKKARQLGIGILEQKGDVLETDTSHLRAY